MLCLRSWWFTYGVRASIVALLLKLNLYHPAFSGRAFGLGHTRYAAIHVYPAQKRINFFLAVV
ncbi:hypothetical protein FS842_006685 [Serendipita sp. 407]|nr:hypothetical protein FS842_006685 [Serendipita sp. 407]